MVLIYMVIGTLLQNLALIRLTVSEKTGFTVMLLCYVAFNIFLFMDNNTHTRRRMHMYMYMYSAYTDCVLITYTVKPGNQGHPRDCQKLS